MIVEKTEKLYSINAMLEDEDELDKKEMKKELVETLKAGKEDIDDLKFPNGFQSTILIDKNEHIIDRQVKLAIKDDWNQHDLVLTSKNVPYGKDKVWKEIILTDSLEEYDEVLSFEYTNDVQLEKDRRTENMNFDFTIEEDGDSTEIRFFSMKSIFKGKDGKQEIQREFDFNNSLYGYGDITALSGEITQISDVKERSSDDKFTIKLNIEDEYDSGTITLNLDSSTELIDQVKLPNLNAGSEEINLVNLTEDDLYDIGREVSENLYSLASKFDIPLDDYYYGY